MKKRRGRLSKLMKRATQPGDKVILASLVWELQILLIVGFICCNRSKARHFQNIKLEKDQNLTHRPSFDVRPFRQLGNISVAQFESKYAGSTVALPTIFTNSTGDAFHAADWTRSNLLKHCGASPLLQPDRHPDCRGSDAGENGQCHHVRIVHKSLVGQQWGGITVANLSDLPLTTFEDVITIQDRSPLGYEIVLFDAPLLHHCPGLSDKVRVPKYFTRDYYLIIDWLQGRNPRQTRNWPSLIVSKRGGGTFMHADSGMTRFWAQQLSGRKRWRVFPLTESHRLAPTPHTHYYYPILFHLDAFHPDFEKYPDADGTPVYEVVTEPGDVIFIPEGWAHQVENLEDSVITSMNFLDNHAIETAAYYLPYSFHQAYNPELFSAFFFPLDRPLPDGITGDVESNMRFDDYFSFRFLAKERAIPKSVVHWVDQGGAQAINTEWDFRGNPALHVAVHYSYFVVAEYLVENGGADVNVLAQNGMTALDLAEFNQNWEMRDWLFYKYRATGRLGQRYGVDRANIK